MATKTKETKASGSLFGGLSKFTDTPQAPPNANMGPKTPWIQFVLDSNKNFDAVKTAIPGIDKNDVVLINGPNGQYEKLERLRIFVVAGTEFYAKRDAGGKIEAAALESKNPRGKDPDGLRQEYESVVLVDVKGKLVPATCSWRSATCRAPLALVAAQQQAAEDPAGFASVSPAHKAALGIDMPFARINGVVKVFDEKPKNGGKPYRASSTTPVPTDAETQKLLEAAGADPEFNQTLNAVIEYHKVRLAEIQKEIK